MALILISVSAIYFLMSHSYQLSLEAKLYYHLANYKKAHTIAKQAYAENRYNRMAATVMTQSNLALEYVVYNEDAKVYLQKIEEISKQEYIEKADKIRMKFMAEIMIERFPKLTPTVVIDTALKEQSKAYAEEFKQIREKIIQSL
jgi:hypothetical protein